jgi:vacuolar-type H+-ATPase subunit E/Vma4
MRRPVLLALLVLTLLAAATACGGNDSEPGEESYNAYRQIEDARDEAESDLRQSIADINDAAVAQDRDAVLAAANDGLDAVDAINDALEAELDAAQEMGAVSLLAGDAKELENGLVESQKSLQYFTQMLELALDDPFLEQPGNIAKVGRLARQGADGAVKGELMVRKADRKLTVSLGLEPRLDQALDNPLTTTTG